jgi:hypothetical protein
MVVLDIEIEILGTVRVEIVCENCAAFLGGRNGEGANTRKDICDYVFRAEDVNQPRMFCVETRIPVYLREVECEIAIRLSLRETSKRAIKA